MIAVISPAKTLDFASSAITKKFTLPDELEKSEIIIKKLKSFSVKKLSDLMALSLPLSTLNVERYQEWSKDFSAENAKQAILAFKGDVYIGLAAETFTEKDLTFSQEHMLILSGLHGYLRPLDLIQPYRLEMGTSISVGRAKNLYGYWSETVTNYINQSIANHQEETLINLASEEYFKVVDKKKLTCKLIDVEFKEKKGSSYQTVGFFAKKARGYMSNFIVKNKLENTKDLKQFDTAGYAFNKSLSTEKKWLFTRELTEKV